VKEVVRPVADGLEDAVSRTFPVKPKLLRVTVEVALLPATNMLGIGDVEEREKSAETPIVTVAE